MFLYFNLFDGLVNTRIIYRIFAVIVVFFHRSWKL